MQFHRYMEFNLIKHFEFMGGISMKNVLKKTAIIIDKINEFFGEIACWLCTILVAVVCFDVFNRYLFNKTNPAMYELEWHIYAVIFLIAEEEPSISKSEKLQLGSPLYT